jgi:5-hydroxyisourate hydrolase
MTTLSTHVLDIERGAPAAGVPVQVLQGERRVAQTVTDADGRVPELASLEAGIYRIEFDAAAYFAHQDRVAPFLKRVAIDFEVQPGATHYHVPLLLSPYACTSYRGS